MPNPAIKAVIWDFGGVVSTSPFEAFARLEAAHGLPQGLIRTLNARNPDTNAWAQLERAELSAEAFDEAFAAEARAQGYQISGRAVLAVLAGELRPRVVSAMTQCKAHFKLGCITNNAPVGTGPSMTDDKVRAAAVERVFGVFDHVLESAKLGIRKPDPRIYALMCEALDVEPGACVYLDDLGINLKPARQMGMHTIKVVGEDQLLEELAGITGLRFDRS